ncbi:MAG: hypothetical protein L7W43_00030 [Rubripirellula sp.]|nr:hypothetical protein [Rubripirellula sp.]
MLQSSQASTPRTENSVIKTPKRFRNVSTLQNTLAKSPLLIYIATINMRLTA